MSLTHVPHEATLCVSGVCVRVRAALGTLEERFLVARPLLGRPVGIGHRRRGSSCGDVYMR